MSWLAWRVQRTQHIVAIVGVALLAVWLVASGLVAGSSWAQTTNHGFDVVLYALPGVLGLALGSSVVASETERGTIRLAWTQSVTRIRWLVSKLAVGGLVVAVVMAAIAPLESWWSNVRFYFGPHRFLVSAPPDVVPKVFTISGVVGIGFVLFAFALGTLLGALIRHAGFAFAAGVPIVVAVRLIVDGWYPTLVAPATVVSPRSLVSLDMRGDVLNSAYLPAGQLAPPPGQTWEGLLNAGGPWKVMRTCTQPLQGAGASLQAGINHCAAIAHLRLVVQYQPESHFWALQGIETAIFLGMGLVLWQQRWSSSVQRLQRRLDEFSSASCSIHGRH